MSTIEDVFRHNLWANMKMLDVCEPLSGEDLDATAPGTYGSVGDTLVHLIRGEEIYAMLLGADPGEPLLDQQEAARLVFDELRRRSRRSGEALVELSRTVEPERVMRGRRKDAEEDYAFRAVVLFLQAINHATEHRVHIATVLSQRGVAVPELDGWTYGREVFG